MAPKPSVSYKRGSHSSFGELKAALQAYLAEVSQTLALRGAQRQPRGQLTLLPPALIIQLNKCESSKRWGELWLVWDRVRPVRGLDFGGPGLQLARWFRRRGVYLDCLAGHVPAAETVARQLLRDARLHASDGAVKYLVLMDGVIFGKDRMHFGDFDIVRMTETQLDRVLETGISRMFFPSAVQDAKPFSNLWYLVTNGKRVALNSDSDTRFDSKNLLEVLFKPPSPLRAEFSTLAAPIEEVAKTLLLWPWWRDSRYLPSASAIPLSEHTLNPHPRFQIIFAVNSSPFAAPVLAPQPGIRYFAPLPPLQLCLDGNHEGWKRWVSRHPQFSMNGASERTTGGSSPAAGWDGGWRILDADDTNLFEKFVHATVAARGQIAETKSCAWWELSLSFLLRAWNSKGLDQLLWEVVAIEASLGDRQEILAGIKRRIEVLLGNHIPLADTDVKTEGSTSTKKLFDNLYDLRSKLVHGAPLERAYEEDLRIGLGLAREVATKMLVILSELAGGLANKKLERFPAREEILEALDQITRNQADSLHPLAHMLQRVLRGSEDFS